MSFPGLVPVPAEQQLADQSSDTTVVLTLES